MSTPTWDEAARAFFAATDAMNLAWGDYYRALTKGSGAPQAYAAFVEANERVMATYRTWVKFK